MEFVQIKRRVCRKSSFFWWCKCYSVIWSSKNVFAGLPGQCTWSLMKNILLMFSRIRPDCRITLTPSERAWFFHILCALFEQIPSGINRDILKNPTWCGAKNSNKLCALSHLVTWIPHTVRGWSFFVFFFFFVHIFILLIYACNTYT